MNNDNPVLSLTKARAALKAGKAYVEMPVQDIKRREITRFCNCRDGGWCATVHYMCNLDCTPTRYLFVRHGHFLGTVQEFVS